MTREQAIQKGFKEFQGEGYKVLAHPKSCFFCDHCTDIIYDYTNGPYMFICDKEQDVENGIKGECPCFEE